MHTHIGHPQTPHLHTGTTIRVHIRSGEFRKRSFPLSTEIVFAYHIPSLLFTKTNINITKAFSGVTPFFSPIHIKSHIRKYMFLSSVGDVLAYPLPEADNITFSYVFHSFQCFQIIIDITLILKTKSVSGRPICVPM